MPAEGGTVELGPRQITCLPPCALLDLMAPNLYTFRDGAPEIFPLASDVVRQARLWILNADAFAEERSGHQGESQGGEGKAPHSATAGKPTRGHEGLDDLSCEPPGCLSRHSGAASPQPAPRPEPPKAAVANPALHQPLASVLLPFQHVPKHLATTLGPPPQVRAQPLATEQQTDLDAAMARGIGDAELPAAVPETW